MCFIVLFFCDKMILIALYQENYIICKFFNKKCVFSIVFINVLYIRLQNVNI